jgi:hypothetical protein
MTDLTFTRATALPADYRSTAVPLPSSPVTTTLLAGIGFQAALMIGCLVAYGLDDRTLNDISVWSKPLKFQSSLIMLMATLALLVPLIRAEVRAAMMARLAATAVVMMSTLEISYIVLQAARGRASHFNTETPLEGMLYSIMGIGAVIILIGCMMFGWLIWRHARPDAPAGLRAGAVIGLLLGSVLTLITALVLGSGELTQNSHWVSGIRSDANGLFLLGWSRSGGDLRVPHFFATHIMQAMPLFGLLLDRMPGRLLRPGLWIGSLAALAVVAATFAQAVSGRPFL